MKRKRLTDTELHEHALEYRRQRALEASGKELAEQIRDVIVDELGARKKRSEVIDGLRITASRSMKVVSLELAKKKLARAVLRRVIRETINKGEWDEAHKEGVISAEIAEECIVEIDATPRIYVNDVKPAASKAA